MTAQEFRNLVYAFDLWNLKHGFDEFSALESRISDGDRSRLDSNLRSMISCIPGHSSKLPDML